MNLEKEAEIRDVWGREAQRQAEGLPVRPTMRDRATGDVIALLEAMDEARGRLQCAEAMIEGLRIGRDDQEREYDAQTAELEMVQADNVALCAVLISVRPYIPHGLEGSTYANAKARIEKALGTDHPGAPLLAELQAARRVVERAQALATSARVASQWAWVCPTPRAHELDDCKSCPDWHLMMDDLHQFEASLEALKGGAQ